MESKRSPNRPRTEDRAWTISRSTRQDAREADACIAPDDWLYTAPNLPQRGEPRATGSTPLPRVPKR